MIVYISLQRRKSVKTGSFYTALVADLGYRKVNLCLDRSVLCELLDCSPQQLSKSLDLNVPEDGDGYSSVPVCSYDTQEVDLVR